MAIAASLLTAGSSFTDTTTYATGSITPTANRLVLAAFASNVFSLGNTPVSPSIVGNSLSWSLVASLNFEFGGGFTNSNLSVFRALNSGPNTSAISITYSIKIDTCAWAIAEFSGIDTSGANGSAAVVQSAVGSASTSATCIVSLAAFANANNATYGVFAVTDTSAGTISISQGAGFTLLATTGQEWCSIGLEWVNSNQTTVLMSTPAAKQGMGGIAIEIAAAPIPLGTLFTLALTGAGG